MDNSINDKAKLLPPITLQEMSCIKLMNRTDTKFVATAEQLHAFLLAVQGKYFIQEINGKRIASYHTTYFDTDDYQMYNMHHCGRTTREKIRVRTYLDNDDTFFEIKNKNNHGRTKKKRIPIQGHDSVQSEHDSIIPFMAKHAWYEIEEISPVIENWFNRITLVNYDKTERLTIDFNLKFHHLKSDGRDKLNRVAIIELKRDGNVPSPALDILRDLRIKRSGFSKYCIGSALTNKALKCNNFKERLTMISKIENKQ
ncbi:MAG: polyphosphate polymerase domain-containing protein [Bacteroidaceae bacterium]|nr:polyphosphate polymerase domain-containing protein [Bacteroidaceae bacterium]